MLYTGKISGSKNGMSCSLCPGEIRIIDSTDEYPNKYMGYDPRDNTMFDLSESCCQYIGGVYVNESGGYCEADLCGTIIFDSNNFSFDTTRDCCEVNGYYWGEDTSTNLIGCLKCSPTNTQQTFINGIEYTEYISSINGSSITNTECCSLLNGYIVKDVGGSSYCVKPIPCLVGSFDFLNKVISTNISGIQYLIRFYNIGWYWSDINNYTNVEMGNIEYTINIVKATGNYSYFRFKNDNTIISYLGKDADYIYTDSIGNTFYGVGQLGSHTTSYLDDGLINRRTLLNPDIANIANKSIWGNDSTDYIVIDMYVYDPKWNKSYWCRRTRGNVPSEYLPSGEIQYCVDGRIYPKGLYE